MRLKEMRLNEIKKMEKWQMPGTIGVDGRRINIRWRKPGYKPGFKETTPKILPVLPEDATAGATASGNIATVVNPHVANPSRKSVAYTGKPGVSGKGPVKQAKGGTYNTGKNALDMDVKLLSSKEPQMLRRQIKEGSLYNEETTDESVKWPNRRHRPGKGKKPKLENASYHVDKMLEEQGLLPLVENPLALGLALVSAGIGGYALYKYMTSDAPESAKSQVASAAFLTAKRNCESGVMPLECERMKKLQGNVTEGLSIKQRTPSWLKKGTGQMGVTDVEKDAGAGKPTNQGQTDVEKSAIASVDRTNMPVQKPKKPLKKIVPDAKPVGRDN